MESGISFCNFIRIRKHGNGTEEKNHSHHTQNTDISFGKNDIFLKV